MQPLQIPQKNSQVLQIDSDYQFKTGDELYFTVKAQPDNDNTDNDALLKKTWTVGTDADYDNEGYLALALSESDTDIDFGSYVYDIKLVTGGTGTTIIYGVLDILPVATLRA